MSRQLNDALATFSGLSPSPPSGTFTLLAIELLWLGTIGMKLSGGLVFISDKLHDSFRFFSNLQLNKLLLAGAWNA